MKRNESPINYKKEALNVFLWSCAYFTVISLVLLVLQAAQSDNRYIEPMRFILIYPFGAAMALGQLLLRAKSIKMAAKTMLHYVITVASFYIFLLSPAGNMTSPVFLILVLSVVYFVVALPIIIVKHIKNKKTEEEMPYQSVYKKGR